MDYIIACDDAVHLEDRGVRVERFTDYHWRVGQRFDVWPTTGTFHDRKANTYGKILRLTELPV